MSNPPADTSTNATLLQFNKIGAIIYVDMTWTTIGVSLLQIVLFGVLVWWLESPPALGKRNTLQNTFTPINTLLLVMILANLINIGLYYAFTQVSELTTKAALITISNAAWSTISVSMLYYSWYRGFSVVDSIAPRWMNLLRSILAISLILQIANTALASVYNLLPASNPIHTAALNWDNAIFVATGVLLIFFDFFTII
ncbi:hypothetical protein BC830DRAFT_237891 [Chytriomyces sp. MP71]|nr:hypothetical protein BC830DRAFT_237891 [Chytriomyces sp. MP71]